MALARGLIAHRDLLWQLTRREVLGRYKGSLLGLAWSFFHPLLMLGVYTFAFAYVFRVGPRGIEGAGDTGRDPLFDFALYAFAGLIVLGVFSEVATRSPLLIVQHAALVKRVVFPLELLPVVQLSAAALHAAMSFAVLLGALAIGRHALPWTALLAPLTLIPLLLVVLGAGWFLAAVGVYLRDAAPAMAILATVMMYLSPVFYSIDMIQQPLLRLAVRLNPLTVPLLSFRRLLLDGSAPQWAWLGGYTLAAAVFAWLSFAFFQRARRGFTDVL